MKKQRGENDFTLELIDNKIEKAFKAIMIIGLLIPLLILLVLLVNTFMDGNERLTWNFLTSYPSRFADQAGILSPLIGSIILMFLTAAMAVPLGVGAAIYLEEYANKGFFTNFIEININNLAGVPSIIYGLLGLGLFVRYMDMGRSLLAGAATLSIMILPLIIISARESMRSVPSALREASLALGADKWMTVRKVVLPLSLPGILTGIILALARAIGETAPIITIGALTYIAFLPDSIMSPFTALPVQIFNWISRPQSDFHVNAAAGIIVLLVIMLLMNSLAIYLRYRLQKKIN